MKVSGAEIITRLLERQGVEILSGIPGGANLPLYDALSQSKLRHVLARHEQGAGFIAQGIARATGRAGVCLGTSGPGATNLITAIADAKLDSVPLVVITGQVPKALIGTDAFQEVDTYGLTVPISKHNYLVRSASELLSVLPEAFTIAESGRPGPVVVDVPKDVQNEVIEVSEWPAPGAPEPPAPPTEAEIAQFLKMLETAERPMLYVGGGVVASNCSDLIIELAERASIPVTMTLQGLGVVPADHRLSLGMLGMHGARATSMLLDEADLLIAIGVRFDDRATGKVSEFCKHANVVHVDVDSSEIHKIKKATLGIIADARATLERLLPRVRPTRRETWTAHVADIKSQYSLPTGNTDDVLSPLGLLRALSELAAPSSIVTTDVGQHQMWVAQYYPFMKPRTLQTSGGLGTMGFGLPAALGAALAKPDSPVICVSGDGSLLMNIQELATLAECGANVKVVLMNNGHLGLVRQQQTLFYGARYSASRFHAETDFVGIAKAFGIAGIELAETADPRAALAEALASPGPALINVPIHPMENVLPMVPPGAANRDMIERTQEVADA
jgi:acetolactate synthase-1/2/3 large subunit